VRSFSVTTPEFGQTGESTPPEFGQTGELTPPEFGHVFCQIIPGLCYSGNNFGEIEQLRIWASHLSLYEQPQNPACNGKSMYPWGLGLALKLRKEEIP